MRLKRTLQHIVIGGALAFTLTSQLNAQAAKNDPFGSGDDLFGSGDPVSKAATAPAVQALAPRAPVITGGNILTASEPTKFQTRNAGVTLECEVIVDEKLGLYYGVMKPELVTLIGRETYGQR